MDEDVVLGVDLGTCSTCAGVYLDGKVHILRNEYDRTITPSCVGFTDDGVVVGEDALELEDPEDSVYGAKRLIGRSFHSACVANDLKHWTFRIDNENGFPVIKVPHHNRKHKPEDISGMVLKAFKNLAERYVTEWNKSQTTEKQVRTDIRKAVITVPAYFDHQQREATKRAGRLADLDVIGIINEPTAAAIAYGMIENNSTRRNLLVYDLGGGTFDVTVLVMEGEELVVKAIEGNSHLGGEDFDHRIMDHFAKDIAVGTLDDRKAKRRLRIACENLKKELTTRRVSTLEEVRLSRNVTIVPHMTRESFEVLNMDLFKETILVVEKAVKKSGLRKDEISNVLLVGGSCRIPCLQEMLVEYFGRNILCTRVFPEEAVAFGATFRAYTLLKNPDSRQLLDILPLSLGVETKGGFMNILVRKGTQIPCREEHKFKTSHYYQTSVRVKVFQGERPLTKFNTFLGTVRLVGITPQPRLCSHVDVIFEVDRDAILQVKVRDFNTRNEEDATMEPLTDLRDEEIVRMVKDAESNIDNDAHEYERVKAVTDFDDYLLDVLNTIQVMKLDNDVSGEVAKAKKWLDECGHMANVEECSRRMRDIQGKWNEYACPELEAKQEASNSTEEIYYLD